MCDNHEKTSNFVGGLVLGGLIGSGLVFLFGTKKGADIRKKIAREWPELSENLQDFVSEARENIEEQIEILPKRVDTVRDTVEDVIEKLPNQFKETLHDARESAENAIEDAATNLHRTAKKRFFLRKK